MSDLPKISIITPSLNQGTFLENNIKSIADQNYPNLEHILIDGGSTDHSLEIIKKYNQHFSYWISESDTGQSDAINKGLRLISGDIITWINSDDELTPGSLLKVANLFNEFKDVDLIHGQTILSFKNGKQEPREADDFLLESQYLAGMAFPQPSSFFRKRILDKVGLLDEHLHFGMDYDLFVRMYLNSNFLNTHETFSIYQIHDESKSNTSQIKFAEEWAVIYSRVLRSLPNTQSLIDQLVDLDLYVQGDSRYQVEKIFPTNTIQNSLPAFLNFQIIFRYAALCLPDVKRIISLIKKEYPDWYESKSLSKLLFRSNYLNAGVINFVRQFTSR